MQSSSNHADKAVAAAGDAVNHFREGGDALLRSKDELMLEFQKLIGEGEALLKSTTSLSGEALARARESFRLQLADAKARAGELSDAARERGRLAAVAADDYVHANPWPALGIAAGVGFLLGAFFTRR
jgi:ElaB/YqjD/DUF883 family membrane-anchored ribosome-binding protein